MLQLLQLLNETLASAIVIVAASMLLYNLTRNLRDRVARTSAVLLGTVTMAYIADVLVSLDPSPAMHVAILRFQWIGIAFMPVAMLHLSDALLATTGLPSRGRRKRIIRLLYLISAGFVLLAAFTEQLVVPAQVFSRLEADFTTVSLRPGPLFLVYVLYFVIVTLVAFLNVGRARRRCLTRSTRRRMGYLQFAMLTPALGIFPFSLLLSIGQEYTILGLVLVNIANIFVILMLAFLAYPLSFFGSRVPDRVVKSELLRFFLRGPMTAVLALATIFATSTGARVLGIQGAQFMPFAVATIILVWQWFIAIVLPPLEAWLIYSTEDSEAILNVQHLSDRLLSRTDLVQLLEATLSAACDYLRVSSAFAALTTEDEPELITAVGAARPAMAALNEEAAQLQSTFNSNGAAGMQIVQWNNWWLIGLHSRRAGAVSVRWVGLLGIQARSNSVNLNEDERDQLARLVHRAANTLDDLLLYGDIVAALEGLLPQSHITAANRAAIDYSPPRTPLPEPIEGDPAQFNEQVRAALRHYWGGPGLTNSRLLDLKVVQEALPENDGNPSKALRAVLVQAIEAQKPDGERKLLSPEWTLYNILEMRFLKGVKVKEVGMKLAMSDADLYRKQRLAIDAVVDSLLEMEQAARSADPTTEALP
ncbi:MAG TPA: histidine kinase N-terminal 7TM domain-containing protein [Candidatus Limnocylindrales bacterium]|nr:histidine kinase N-terminal 7TM domain-containing protein [Candidatus Limnocylindrales bacterium]